MDHQHDNDDDNLIYSEKPAASTHRHGSCSESSFPNVLAVELPRLLHLLDKDLQQQKQKQKQPQQQQHSASPSHCRSQENLTDILARLLQRLVENVNIPAQPWITGLLPFLRCWKNHHPTTITCVLKFLQAALVRYGNQQDGINSSYPNTSLPESAVREIFRFYNAVYRHQHLHRYAQYIFLARWLCLDIMAILHGMPVFQNWDTPDEERSTPIPTAVRDVPFDSDASIMKPTYEYTSPPVVLAVRKALVVNKADTELKVSNGSWKDAGVLSLMLDLVFFQPKRSSDDELHENGAGAPLPLHPDQASVMTEAMTTRRSDALATTAVAVRSHQQTPTRKRKGDVMINSGPGDVMISSGPQHHHDNLREGHLHQTPRKLSAITMEPPSGGVANGGDRPQKPQPAPAGLHFSQRRRIFMQDEPPVDVTTSAEPRRVVVQDDDRPTSPASIIETKNFDAQHVIAKNSGIHQPPPPPLPLPLPVDLPRELRLALGSESASQQGMSLFGEFCMNYRLCMVRHQSKLVTTDHLGLLDLPLMSQKNMHCVWNVDSLFYFEQLKFAALRFAIGLSPLQGGLFYGDVALLVAVVTVLSSSSPSAHRQLATNYINKLSAAKQLERNFGLCASQLQIHVSHDEPQRASLSFVSSLMILLVGDFAAAPVFQRHAKIRFMWESVLGPKPSPRRMYRRPIPETARVIKFISSLFVSFENGKKVTNTHHLHICMVVQLDKEEYAALGVMLLLDLLHAGAPHFRRQGVCVMHLIDRMYRQVLERYPNRSNDEEQMIKQISQKCVLLAMEYLSGMANGLSELNHDQQQLQLQQRVCAYKLILDIANNAQVVSGKDDGGTMSFELPILLFACAEMEPVEAKSNVVAALEALLKLNSQRVMEQDAPALELEAMASPLLWTLVTATCSSSLEIRQASAQWTSELLSHMDPMSARTLANFMVEDPDPTISQYVSQASRYTSVDDESSYEEQVKELPASFFDLADDVERSLLELELDDEVQKIANLLQIPFEAAALLLHDYHFQPMSVIHSINEDRVAAIHRAGLSWRCNENQKMTKSTTIDEDVLLYCGICYEEYSDESSLHYLPCHHAFCTECWKQYIEANLELSSSSILTLTCPCQDCSERLTCEDVRVISLELVPTWRHAFLNSSVERSKRRRFCPGPDCSMVAVAPEEPTRLAITPSAVKCARCMTQFCLSCGLPPHVPAQCEDAVKFHGLYSSTPFWIENKTKPCPGCSVAVNKDGGCDTMNCTQCRATFCWKCLALEVRHNHTCNTSDTDKSSSSGELFFLYSQRYDAHDVAQVRSQRLLNDLNDQTGYDDMKLWNLLEASHVATFRSGLETLIQARRLLKNACIFSYENHATCGDGLSVFDRYQAALGSSADGLGRLTELDLNKIHAKDGWQGVQSHVRSIGLYSALVINSIRRVLLNV